MAEIDEFRSVAQATLRGTDSNSLLRLYDRAREVVSKSPVQQLRAKAGKTLERILAELRRRSIPV